MERTIREGSRAYQHNLNGSQLEIGSLQLEARNVSLAFGGVRALERVSLEVRQGDVHALIGPNGAGKTSLLNCISGLYKPQAGQIVLHGPAGAGTAESLRPERGSTRSRDLAHERPSQIARLGVARSFQNIELFRHMSVVDNLLLGRHVHMRHRLWPALWYLGSARRQEIAHRGLVEEVIDLLELQAVRAAPVATLSYGAQKRVELGRALCMQPALLLLDEPIAGMNAEEKEDMTRAILDLSQLAGMSVVLVEHDMAVVMDISDRITVLDFGRVIADGTPSEIGRHQAVIDAYLGHQAI